MVAVVESIAGPQGEVVSIYNGEFLTPLSRPQYFIEVYRCVKVDIGECPSFGPAGYPVPEEIENIEIVVPDTTNNGRDSRGRDSSDKNKFYKYVVYNHTSCKCGTLKFRDSALYKTITNNEVSEAHYKTKYKKNPVNLIHRCHRHVCNPQPRYSLTHKHILAAPQSKYLAYQQCLPGSVALKKPHNDNVSINMISGGEEIVNVLNDISCKAYDGENDEKCPTIEKDKR